MKLKLGFKMNKYQLSQKKNFICLLYCLMISSISFAKNTDNLQIIQENVKKMEQKQCPRGQDVQNREWVKQKIKCLFDIDQYVLMNTQGLVKDKKLSTYLESVIKKNSNELKNILRTYGWVTISQFGKQTDNYAWLIVQHSDHDPAFQASVAFLLGLLAEKGETSRQNYAYLVDRIVLKYPHLGLKQKFGTQFEKINNDLKLKPYEGTLEEVEYRRKEIGLDPLDRYLNEAKAMYLDFGN